MVKFVAGYRTAVASQMRYGRRKPFSAIRMNTPLLYYRNPLGSLTYDPRGFVTLQWSAEPITPAELQSLYAHTLQALRHHGTRKLLTNQVHRQPLPPEEQAWLAQQWVPQAISECAYSHCAIVESEHEAGRAAARAVGSRLSVALDFRYFQDAVEAENWLISA